MNCPDVSNRPTYAQTVLMIIGVIGALTFVGSIGKASYDTIFAAGKEAGAAEVQTRMSKQLQDERDMYETTMQEREKQYAATLDKYHIKEESVPTLHFTPNKYNFNNTIFYSY